MLKHQVEINVRKPTGEKVNVLKGGDFRLKDRIINALLGKGQRMLVLVPSDSVQSVSIREVDDKYETEGGKMYEQNK